ncbi:hypothetical protein GCM10027299_34560 [Larkinella ripae]
MSSHPETLHVALATYPQEMGDEYVKYVKQSYKKFSKDIDNNFSLTTEQKSEILYDPLIYHIFGSYDIAFITLVDSYKFAQKLFIPEPSIESRAQFGPNTYQVITGICPIIDENLVIGNYLQFISDPNKFPFISITHLKLNNGILIGNGNDFIANVYKIIELEKEKRGDSLNYIILQSFSWAEICLITFSEDINIIADFITALRVKRLIDIEDNVDILNNSLYNLLVDCDSSNIMHSHIFSDTHSYFGIEYDKFSNDEEYFIGKELYTEVEWQIKPGHLGDLLEKIIPLKAKDKIDEKVNVFDIKSPFFVAGKSDYIIPEVNPHEMSNNQQLFLLLRKTEKENNILQYVRKIKTRIRFPIKSMEFIVGSREVKGILQLNPDVWSKKVIINTEKIGEIRKKLKALKVSRQMREQVLKVFHNFNTGIQDPVLFIYFIDFCVFISQLEDQINNKYNEVLDNDKLYPVGDFEKVLRKYVHVFEEGYQIRSLNTYQFEEINDFDVDFNSSIQQILTTYNTLIYEITQIFYETNQLGPVVQLNLQNTVGNLIAINYNVYHLTSPEFVFSTLVKEIFNIIPYFDKPGKNVYLDIKDKFYKEIINNNYLSELYRDGKIDFDYIYIDVIRLIYTFNMDIQLFEYWFWSYNFQNSSLYNQNGSFSVHHFVKELFRVLFVIKLFDPEYAIQIKCPLSELESYWNTYFKRIGEEIDNILSNSNNQLKKIFINDANIWMKLIYTEEFEETDEYPLSNFNKEVVQILPKLCPITTDYNHHFNVMKRLSFILNNYEENKRQFEIDKTFHKLKFPVSSKSYISGLMYSYLRILYEKNGKKIYLLKRNWETGSPFKRFYKNQPIQPLFSIDSFGGIFFTSRINQRVYFSLRNTVLQSLLHYSQVMKRQQINSIINNPIP